MIFFSTGLASTGQPCRCLRSMVCEWIYTFISSIPYLCLARRMDCTHPSHSLPRHLDTSGWSTSKRSSHMVEWFTIICAAQLGLSALAGFSLFLLVAPLQQRIMSIQFKMRKKSMKWTDQRARLLIEVLGMNRRLIGLSVMSELMQGAMRIVKYFSYEIPFSQRRFLLRYSMSTLLHIYSVAIGIYGVRRKELSWVRKIQNTFSAR